MIVGQSEELQKYLKEAYTIISKEGHSLIVKQFAELLEKVWGPTAKESFIKHCEATLKFIKFDIDSLDTVKYIAFVGT